MYVPRTRIIRPAPTVPSGPATPYLISPFLKLQYFKSRAFNRFIIDHVNRHGNTMEVGGDLTPINLRATLEEHGTRPVTLFDDKAAEIMQCGANKPSVCSNIEHLRGILFPNSDDSEWFFDVRHGWLVGDKSMDDSPYDLSYYNFGRAGSRLKLGSLLKLFLHSPTEAMAVVCTRLNTDPPPAPAFRGILDQWELVGKNSLVGYTSRGLTVTSRLKNPSGLAPGALVQTINSSIYELGTKVGCDLLPTLHKWTMAMDAQGHCCMHGEVTGHPMFQDGSVITTAPFAGPRVPSKGDLICTGRVRTLVYRLAQKLDFDYDWLVQDAVDHHHEALEATVPTSPTATAPHLEELHDELAYLVSLSAGCGFGDPPNSNKRRGAQATTGARSTPYKKQKKAP